MSRGEIFVRGGALLVAANLLIGGPPVVAAAQEAAGSEAAAEAFKNAFVAAVRAYDVDAWAELVTPDVVMMSPSGTRTEGREDFHALWTRTFAGRTGPNPLAVEIGGIEAAGDLMVVRADYGPAGARPVGQYVWLLRRDDVGAWKLAWWIFNRR